MKVLYTCIKVCGLGRTKTNKKENKLEVIGDFELMSIPHAFSSTWFHTDKTGILTHSSVG